MEKLSSEDQNRVKSLNIFWALEKEHFDECVKKGLMTTEERERELETLHEKVRSGIRKIIIPKH